MIESKTIYELLGITKEQLDFYIENKLLCDKHINLIKNYFDSEYRKIKGIKWSYEENQMYYISIKKRINALKNRKDLNTYSPKKSLLQSLDITLEEFINIKELLPQEIIEFLTTHFDEQLNFNPSFHMWSLEDKKTYEKKYLKIIKQALSPENSQKFIPLTARTDTEYTELKKILNKLPEKSKEIIKKYYRLDFYPYPDLTMEKSELEYFRKYTIPRIKELSRRPSIDYRFDVYEDLTRNLGITKYQLSSIIPLLPKYNRKFIKDYYDENYIIKKDIELTKYDRRVIGVIIFSQLKWLIKYNGFDIIRDEHKKIQDQEIFEETLKKTNSLEECFKYHKLYIQSIKNREDLSMTEKKNRLTALRKVYKNHQNSEREERHLVLTRKTTK